MKRFQLPVLMLFVLCFFAGSTLFAQLSAPIVESVYGGRINAITGFSLTADSSRIFISTESANSIFYADVHATASTPSFGKFTVMPGLDAAAGYGGAIHNLAAHESSGYLFFSDDGELLSSHPSSSAVNTVFAGGMHSFVIENSWLVIVDGPFCHFGTLDVSANFTNAAGSPISMPAFPQPPTIFVSPADSTVYLFSEGNSPNLYKLSDQYHLLSSSTTYLDISPATLNTSVEWRAFGVGPDGRLLIAGSDGPGKYIAYSDDETNWTEYVSSLGGAPGTNIACSRDTSSYHVYFASGYNSNNGNSGSWLGFGQPGGFETHANDGAVYVDPVNDHIVYMTTDQGIGVSTDRGGTIFEINYGVEAVQVRDFDMTPSKNTAWLASKSGIRKVTNYLSTPLWTNAIFPNGDGSPYYSAEMVPGDTNTVYVGNLRVYKTTDGGNTWSQSFTPENAPYNFSDFGTKVTAIEVCDYSHDVVFAGCEIAEADKGGLFYSNDAGASWDQILFEVSTVGQDVDVFDIVFNLEGSDTVAYVGVEYDLVSPQGRSVYRLTKNGSAWNVAQDMNASTTSTGSLIVATIRDVFVTSTGDTIYAAGTDAGINHPIAYYKPLNTTELWTPMITSGFPFASGKEATAITVGIDTVYCAVDNEIYYYPLSGSSWALGHTYPFGQRINFLYFDDLLVGTDTGLYGHNGTGGVTGVKSTKNLNSPNGFTLNQNYPNPFNPTTIISYQIPGDSKVTVKIFDLLGREVMTLVNEIQPAGSHQVRLDASNLPNGLYFYTISAKNFKATRKMILLK